MAGGCEGAVAREEEQFGGYTVSLEGLHTHDEEEAREDAVRNEVQTDEEGSCHGSEGEKALRQVGEALLDDVGGLERVAAFVLALLIELRDGLGDAKRLGVEWGLRDKAIGEREAEDAGHAGGQAEEEQVPVEAGGLSEGELGALGDEGGHLRGSAKCVLEKGRGNAGLPLWSNQKRMVKRMANGMARNTSPTDTSLGSTIQLDRVVGKNALLVGNVARSTGFIRPIYTKPVKKMSVRGVP